MVNSDGYSPMLTELHCAGCPRKSETKTSSESEGVMEIPWALCFRRICHERETHGFCSYSWNGQTSTLIEPEACPMSLAVLMSKCGLSLALWRP